MDVQMKDASLDDLVKRDKKLGRMRNGNNRAPLRGGRPLPGRGRGGNQQNVQTTGRTNNNNNVQRVRRNPNGIQKQRNNNNQPVAQTNNQGLNMSRTAIRNRNRRARLAQMRNSGAVGNQQNVGTANRRLQLRQARQNRRPRGRAGALANVQNNTRNANNNRLQKRQPQAPVVANNQRANQVNEVVVQGTLAERKLRVKGIDARTVTAQDLQKLFAKCGPLIRASFDMNEFGGYLGTATVIYSKASSATRAIKDYNLAQIDGRPMKVAYHTPAAAQPAKQANNNNVQQPKQSQIRRTNNNRIGKNAQGKTLNVMGAARRRRNPRQ